ncbi:hypothetical protein AB0885_35215, partial [Streptomyces sp. NPDC005534]
MDVRCPNCGGPLRRFRKLTKDEEAHVRRILEVDDPAAFHRCTRKGRRTLAAVAITTGLLLTVSGCGGGDG